MENLSTCHYSRQSWTLLSPSLLSTFLSFLAKHLLKQFDNVSELMAVLDNSFTEPSARVSVYLPYICSGVMSADNLDMPTIICKSCRWGNKLSWNARGRGLVRSKHGSLVPEHAFVTQALDVVSQLPGVVVSHALAVLPVIWGSCHQLIRPFPVPVLTMQVTCLPWLWNA